MKKESVMTQDMKIENAVHKAKEIIDSQIVATDRRVLVLEESQKTIREYLTEIRSDLKEIKDFQRQGY